MPIALLALGFALAAVGINGTQGQLASLLASDFSGAGNFWYFVIGVFFVGSIGYSAPFSDSSRLFIILICLVFLLSNNGFWVNLQSALKNPLPAKAPASPSSSVPQATLAGQSSTPDGQVPKAADVKNNPAAAFPGGAFDPSQLYKAIPGLDVPWGG